MAEMTFEHCEQCGELTGRAGRGDDSLFVGDQGPLCSSCYCEVDRARIISELTDILESGKWPDGTYISAVAVVCINNVIG